MTDTIELLSDRDKVRQRPGMYIGDNGDLGLETIVREVIDNMVDEYPNYSDPTKPIIVVLKDDNSVLCRDYGRGISPNPSVKNNGEIEERLAFTRLGAGGKFKSNRVDNGNKFSGGLHGVGASATNFMSEFFDVTIWKNGRVYHDRFENGGEPVVNLVKGLLPSKKQTGEVETGTQIHFKADRTVMRTTNVNADALHAYFRQISYLNPGMRVEFTNERDEEDTVVYYSENGLLDFIHDLSVNPDNPEEQVKFLIEPFIVGGEAVAEVLGEPVEMQATIGVGFTEDTYVSECFTNGIYNHAGGTHYDGFKQGLTKLIRHYYKEFQSEIESKNSKNIDLIKKVNKVTDVSTLIRPRDLSKRVFVVIDFKHTDPILHPQTKDKLASQEAVQAVDQIFYQNAMMYLDRHVPAILTILTSIVKELAEKAKNDDSNAKIDRKTQKAFLSTKFAPASSRNPKEKELFIVEGDSAGGSIKTLKDSKYQAVFALRGKPLNVWKSTLSKALANPEIATIFTILGTGYGKNYDDSKLQYDKIIITTDQDVDGLHIRTLLLTLFWKYCPELILNGHVYFLDTPLFVNELKGKTPDVYTYSNVEQQAFLDKHRKKVIDVHRKKGLGELTEPQVIDSILTPETRRLSQVVITDEDAIDNLVDTLMGDDSKGRKRYILEENSK